MKTLVGTSLLMTTTTIIRVVVVIVVGVNKDSVEIVDAVGWQIIVHDDSVSSDIVVGYHQTHSSFSIVFFRISNAFPSQRNPSTPPGTPS